MLGRRWSPSRGLSRNESQETSQRDSADQAQVAREMAMRMLARRSYGAAELAKRLERKGIAPEVVRDVMAWAKERGWIDDAAYAAALVESRQRSLRGRLLIRHELLQKGIDRSIVDGSIAQGIDEEGELAAALRLAKAAVGQYQGSEKWALLPPLERRKVWAKVAGKLLRRGFTMDVVTRVIRVLAEGEWEPDGTLLDTPGTGALE